MASARDSLEAEFTALEMSRHQANTTRSAQLHSLTEAERSLTGLRARSERCAVRLERLKSDKAACVSWAQAAELGPAQALAEHEATLAELEHGAAHAEARELGSMGSSLESAERALLAIDGSLAKLAADKAEYAKAKQFREAGVAKKEIEAAESEKRRLGASLAAMKLSLGSEAKKAMHRQWCDKRTAAQAGVREAQNSLEHAQRDAAVHWVRLLKGRQLAEAARNEEQQATEAGQHGADSGSGERYISAQLTQARAAVVELMARCQCEAVDLDNVAPIAEQEQECFISVVQERLKLRATGTGCDVMMPNIPELPAPTAGTVKVVVDADMPSPVKADSDEDCSSTDDDSD
jgi:hypothetical protein